MQTTDLAKMLQLQIKQSKGSMQRHRKVLTGNSLKAAQVPFSRLSSNHPQDLCASYIPSAWLPDASDLRVPEVSCFLHPALELHWEVALRPWLPPYHPSLAVQVTGDCCDIRVADGLMEGNEIRSQRLRRPGRCLTQTLPRPGTLRELLMA